MEYWFKKKNKITFTSFIIQYGTWVRNGFLVIQMYYQYMIKDTNTPFFSNYCDPTACTGKCKQPIPMRACTPQTWFHLLISFNGGIFSLTLLM